MQLKADWWSDVNRNSLEANEDLPHEMRSAVTVRVQYGPCLAILTFLKCRYEPTSALQVR